MKFVVDMNLSPAWVPRLRDEGWDAEHWSWIGEPTAADSTILEETDRRGAVLLTADLDFGAILAARGSHRPSVILLRLQDLTPSDAGDSVVAKILELSEMLERGCLLAIDERGGRVRLLPLP